MISSTLEGNHCLCRLQEEYKALLALMADGEGSAFPGSYKRVMAGLTSSGKDDAV